MKQSSRTVRSSLAGVMAAAVLGLTPIAFAPDALAQTRERPSPEARAEKRQARMEQMVRERLSPKLGLDQKQEDALLRAFDENAKERMQAMAAVKAERQALATLLEKGASERELAAQLSRLQAAQENLPRPGALLEKTEAFLTVEQQAKLALVAPEGKAFKHGRKGKMGKMGKMGRGGAEMRGLEKPGAR